ncbi:hypothetical protein [Metapseudomonas otitidis]|uniref:hypothetical protein n=1 Tax=Metapseudomonas otitidis TaxID=319939 RepID=UPI0013F5B424|nr:hypothetical protein [Pseudomonas otitidis]
MNATQICVAIAACGLLYGCDSGNTQTTFGVTADDQLVRKALPSIRQACPGLDKYADQFESVRVENQYRTTVVFDIPDAARIPSAYKAGGHTCFLEIDDKGSTLFIEKLACKSVCLDQVDVPEGQLKLPLGGGPQA